MIALAPKLLHHLPHLLRGVLPALISAALLLVAQPAAASPTGLERTFTHGTSPGEPTTLKLFTVSSLYAASLASFGFGGYTLFDAAGESSQLAGDQAAGCSSRSQCDDLAQREQDVAAQHRSGLMFLALGSAALLSGMATAALWKNDTTELAASPTSVRLRLSF